MQIETKIARIFSVMGKEVETCGIEKLLRFELGPMIGCKNNKIIRLSEAVVKLNYS